MCTEGSKVRAAVSRSLDLMEMAWSVMTWCIEQVKQYLFSAVSWLVVSLCVLYGSFDAPRLLGSVHSGVRGSVGMVTGVRGQCFCGSLDIASLLWSPFTFL